MVKYKPVNFTVNYNKILIINTSRCNEAKYVNASGMILHVYRKMTKINACPFRLVTFTPKGNVTKIASKLTRIHTTRLFLGCHVFPSRKGRTEETVETDLELNSL